MSNLKLRKLQLKDLQIYEYWQLPKHEYHQFNGPYFSKKTEEEVSEHISKLRIELNKKQAERLLKIPTLIVGLKDEILGEVNWYWKSEETNWLEIGLLIYDEQNWSKGLGFVALQLWITKLFAEKSELVRIGLTTWSGNIGMMKLSEKLGLQKEAVYRKARIVDGLYYDSVSFGILREEWESANS